MDFTLDKYRQLIISLQHAGFFFQTFAESLHSKESSSGTAAKNSSPYTNKPQPVQLSTPNPEHVTRNPEPRNPKPGTRNTEHGTRNTEHGTRNTEHETPNPKPETRNTEHRTRNTEHRTPNKLIILRHDVDLLPQNSLRFAQIQHNLGIKGSYYFRAVPESWDEKIIKEIHHLGHEVGYHYESLTTCRGNIEEAWSDFTKNLNNLRNLVPVSTICMHGSPRSPYDSKDIWKKYDYRTLGIIGEPYFDLNFGTEFTHPEQTLYTKPQTRNTEHGTRNPEHETRNPKPGTRNTEHGTQNKFFYLTDTGRRWDGWRVSIRDKVSQQEEWIKQGLVFRSTDDIIKAANEGRLPDKIMMTFHPQRWTDRPLPWLKEMIWQNIKNQVKLIIIKRKI